MTPDELRALDARVHSEVMGLEPERIAIATSDGGQSACATEHRNGPGPTEARLREWLEEQHRRGHCTEYEMGEWLRYPRYTTSIADAWLVVEKMLDTPGRNGDHHEVVIDVGVASTVAVIDMMEEWEVRVTADTAPLAICLAALKAMEDK